MLRRLVLLSVAGVAFAGLVVTAADAPKPEQNVQQLTFSMMKTDDGAAIKITVGNHAFLVSEFSFLSADGKPAGTVKIKDGEMQMSDEQSDVTVGFKELRLNAECARESIGKADQ